MAAVGYLHFLPDPNLIHKREQFVAVQTLLKAPRSQIIFSKLLLLAAYLDAEKLDRGLDKVEELSAETMDLEQSYQFLTLSSWLFVRKDMAQRAPGLINKWLCDEKGKLRPDYLPLLMLRSRAYGAMGKWTEAQQDVDKFLSSVGVEEFCRKYEGPGPVVYAQVFLIKGFIAEHNGDRVGAEQAWKAGYEVCRKYRELGTLPSALLASLSNAVTAEDADEFLHNVGSTGISSSPAARYLRHSFLPSELAASVLRNMWRTKRGRVYAFDVTFQKLPTKLANDVQALLAVAEVLRQAVQGTPDLHDLTPDEDKLIWDFCEDLYGSFQKRAITEPQILQAFMTYRGNNTAFGWQGLAPHLSANLRGPLAYTLGRNFRHLKRPNDAKALLRTALEDSPAGTPLHRLAESELQSLTADGR
jgi:hypothetical protein